MRPVDCLGNLATAGLLLAVDIPWTFTRWLLFAIVGLLDKLCGSGSATVRNKREWHSQRYSTQPIYKDEERGELDAEAMLRASDFPIPPDELLDKARRVLDLEFGTKDGETSAENTQSPTLAAFLPRFSSLLSLSLSIVAPVCSLLVLRVL